MNILVCDDEIEIVDAIEIYLKNEGYSVYKAHNGVTALELLNSADIQLVIMDIMMPFMDGIKATTKIREKYNVPVLMLSAKSEDTDKIIGLKLDLVSLINQGLGDFQTKSKHQGLLLKPTFLTKSSM